MVNKRTYFLFIILHLFFIDIAAQDTNSWNSQISYYNDIEQIQQNENTIYSLTDGKLFSYNNSDESIEQCIKNDGGNTDIKHIGYSSKHKCLLITRADANIELVYDDKSYVTISDLKNTTQNIDKTINKILILEDLAYLATNFGFLTINLSKKEIRESGVFNTPFYSITVHDNKLFAPTKNGVLYIDLTDNVQDLNSWKTLEVSTYYTDQTKKDSTFSDNEIRDILSFKNQLHFFAPDQGVFRMENFTTVKRVLDDKSINSMQLTNNDHLIIAGTNSFWDFQNLNSNIKTYINDITCITPNGNSVGEYWVASSGNNLSLIKTNESNYEYIKRWIAPSGPATNYPFSLTIDDKQLITTGGGFYLDRMGNPASLSILKDSKWTNIYPSDISGPSGFISQDLVYAISNPNNQNQIFASSWGEGLYEFESAKFQNRYDNTNSSIEPIIFENGNKTTRVSGMVFDKNENLWILNSMVNDIIKVRLKSGEWTSLNYSEIAKASTNPKNILIDKYSNKWITSVGDDAYLFVMNENGTINDTSDDKYVYVSKSSSIPFVDQDGKNLNISEINGIAEDVNGNFWLGTDIGPFIVYSSSNIFAKNIIFNKIKIEKESGSNSVTGLLEGIKINAIAIDGANRKWIATQKSGVYLISHDNKEIIQHFTLENSPLPSNNIISLAIDSHNGIVYLGTERGLMTYGGVATKGSENFSDVYAYPNPVRPEYIGSVNITGLQPNSRVKITDLKGNLINEGKSLGGQYSWNIQNAKENRVDSGIYLVFGSTDNGSEGVVTKIMIIN